MSRITSQSRKKKTLRVGGCTRSQRSDPAKRKGAKRKIPCPREVFRRVWVDVLEGRERRGEKKQAGRRGEGYSEKATSGQIKKMRTKISKRIRDKKKMKREIKEKKMTKRKLNPSREERWTRRKRPPGGDGGLQRAR